MLFRSGVVPQATVNDPLASQQWWLKSPNLFGAWDYVRTQGKVTVAVLDTTPHSTHPDLKDNLDMTHARSFIGTTSDSSVGERPLPRNRRTTCSPMARLSPAPCRPAPTTGGASQALPTTPRSFRSTCSPCTRAIPSRRTRYSSAHYEIGRASCRERV